jgi:hypothetical protein
MKVLKKKFKKKFKKIPGGDKLEYKPKTTIVLPRIKIKPKQGKWCDVYEGRLPYPIECQNNKASPISYIFESGEKTLVYDRTCCIKCKRAVEFIPWKNGEWDKIKEAIANKEDLRDMFPPGKEIE